VHSRGKRPTRNLSYDAERKAANSGKQVGTDEEQRADVRQVYEATIARPGGEGVAAKWSGLRDRWSKSPAAGEEVDGSRGIQQAQGAAANAAGSYQTLTRYVQSSPFGEAQMKPRATGARHVVTVANLRALANIAWHPEIKSRRVEFDELVSKLVSDHSIDDEKVLRRAIDFAVRRYHDKDVLSKRDAALLLRHIPEVTNVLLYPWNDKRIADLLIRREDSRIRGGTYDPSHHAQTIHSVGQVGALLVELEKSLKTLSSRRRPANVRLRSAVLILEDYWRGLPEKRWTKTFTINDKKLGRRRAASEAMKFAEAVIGFIDPAALPGLPSATRPRLKRIAKIDT
jgi:hypothetical protein